MPMLFIRMFGFQWEKNPEFEERIKLLKPYQVNMEMIKKTNNPNVIFLPLFCLHFMI